MVQLLPVPKGSLVKMSMLQSGMEGCASMINPTKKVILTSKAQEVKDGLQSLLDNLDDWIEDEDWTMIDNEIERINVSTDRLLADIREAR